MTNPASPTFADHVLSRASVVSINALIWSFVGFSFSFLGYFYRLFPFAAGEPPDPLALHFDRIIVLASAFIILLLILLFRSIRGTGNTIIEMLDLLRREFGSFLLNTGSFFVAAGASQINAISDLPFVAIGFALWLLFSVLTWTDDA